MAKTNYQSIDEYHDAFTTDTQKRMEVIRGLIHEVAPEVQEVISYQIPAFKIGGKFYLIYYSAYSKHLSLSSPWSEEFLSEFEPKFKGMKFSKSAIQFPHDKPLPLDLIKRILKFRKTEYEKVKSSLKN